MLLHQPSEAGKHIQDPQSMPPDHSWQRACLPKGYLGQSAYFKQICSQSQNAPYLLLPAAQALEWDWLWKLSALCVIGNLTNCSCCFIFISKPEVKKSAAEGVPGLLWEHKKAESESQAEQAYQQMPSRMFQLQQGKKRNASANTIWRDA